MGYVAREGLKKIIVPLLKKATEKKKTEMKHLMVCLVPSIHVHRYLQLAVCSLALPFTCLHVPLKVFEIRCSRHDTSLYNAYRCLVS